MTDRPRMRIGQARDAVVRAAARVRRRVRRVPHERGQQRLSLCRLPCGSKLRAFYCSETLLKGASNTTAVTVGILYTVGITPRNASFASRRARCTAHARRQGSSAHTACGFIGAPAGGSPQRLWGKDSLRPGCPGGTGNFWATLASTRVALLE